ncbi:hypothetical protein KIL84_008930 [Mauremys mutica]|uniref:Uncharacterized protein n=1 Tax=Mauremys mutica TaxID=74926 RepID=A0A9D3X3U4_9SAUR|nr:hypothetical protein KIL84_008930 [Mauremys mutica]
MHFWPAHLWLPCFIPLENPGQKIYSRGLRLKTQDGSRLFFSPPPSPKSSSTATSFLNKKWGQEGKEHVLQLDPCVCIPQQRVLEGVLAPALGPESSCNCL